MDARGETCRISIESGYVIKPAFNDGQPALKGYIQLPCGDVYAAWWPVFTDWWPEPCDECGGPFQHSGNPPGCGE